jgi:hypothetical protein
MQVLKNILLCIDFKEGIDVDGVGFEMLNIEILKT